MKNPSGPLYILGTGVLAEEFYALAHDLDVDVAAFIENMIPDKAGQSLCGKPILWVDDMPDGILCICALSTTERSRFIDQVRDRARFANLVHPSAIILSGTTLGPGTVVSAGVIIASNTQVGDHVFINRGVRIGHHTRIGDFVTIQPGANIAGLVKIGSKAYVGMGAIVIERLNIGQGATIAAGAVTIRNVPERVLVAGNPAVVKKENLQAR